MLFHWLMGLVSVWWLFVGGKNNEKKGLCKKKKTFFHQNDCGMRK